MGGDCTISPDCINKDDKNHRCLATYVEVGWEACDNEGKMRRIICCKAKTAPKKCVWRGAGEDCNGQCHKAEATLYKSKYGGGDEREEGMGRCDRGCKVFCCEEKDSDEFTDGSRWTRSDGRRKDDEHDFAFELDLNPEVWMYNRKLCEMDKSYRCGPDPYADDSELDEDLPNPFEHDP
ncbi:hypothetical protein BKA56DRAFT_675608 [Ilyonectria sp. MPI-CAGE-AT-0026]|nr:hypothetical protein BKA56DRAFT_675608 [Ilyonectria sp. MPI-CAGE-AT-0026]